ncbi:MAG: IS1 family transposase [Gammaproteobacteria bacterium]|nr:IS1 family transposase [Gammaproteobacteria bacterium]
MSILSETEPLSKHTASSSETSLPMCCLQCGSITFKKNGKYSRKVHCDSESKIINPTNIQRYYCFGCKHTFSALPAWLAPKRWYLWAAQENALRALAILGYSIRMISKRSRIARSTLKRWFNRLKDRFSDHADQLKQLLPNVLGRTEDAISFWKAWLSHFSLSQAMGQLQAAGIEIP